MTGTRDDLGASSTPKQGPKGINLAAGIKLGDGPQGALRDRGSSDGLGHGLNVLTDLRR